MQSILLNETGWPSTVVSVKSGAVSPDFNTMTFLYMLPQPEEKAFSENAVLYKNNKKFVEKVPSAQKNGSRDVPWPRAACG